MICRARSTLETTEKHFSKIFVFGATCCLVVTIAKSKKFRRTLYLAKSCPNYYRVIQDARANDDAPEKATRKRSRFHESRKSSRAYAEQQKK